MTIETGHQDDTTVSIPRRLIVCLALGAGLSAGNLYYAQPLLDTIADSFDVGSGTAGLIVTFAQIGYACGLLLVVPLGDVVSRRRLITALIGLTTVSLVVAAAAPSMAVLVGITGLIGLGAVVAQILVPLAASLASDAERGRVVGTVMTGLLLGILLARTASGVLGDAIGWRAIYVAAATLTVGLGILLRRVLPDVAPAMQVPYRSLLRGTVELFRTDPVVRHRALYGSLGFGTFSVLWTTLSFLLSEPPYEYSDATIGLFGLLGAAGALAANGAGRLADRGLTRSATLVTALALVASFAVLAAGERSLLAVVVGILLLDIASTALHILNQGTIYARAAGAHSQVNGFYMTMYFVGGAVGSALAANVYDRAGWGGVCVLGAAMGVGIALLWFVEPSGPGLRVHKTSEEGAES